MPNYALAIAFLKKPIEDVYSAATGVLREKIALIRTSAKVKGLHKKLYESQRVKTIWNTDRALSLTSFYYPVSIHNSSCKTRLTSLDDLPDNHNVIFGTVGQGKSILLRYLLGKEIKSGIRIPVLAELRNIESETLEDFLCTRFCLLLGIDCDLAIFSTFAKAGKISFFLDGFDEIDPSGIQRLNQQIEDLSYKYEACRIILTSRPDAECRHLTRFVSHNIFPITEEDLEPFYRKITRGDQDFTSRLMAAIRVSPIKMKELVTTPLLATLLAVSYQAAQRIPLDFSEFYEALFQILLVRHDASKKGWRRQRRTKLSDREIQQVFEAFSFAARKRKAISFDRDVAYELAKESLSETKYSTDPQLFIDDIRKITCLLQDDGKKISFVHQSIQEYFASRYIKSLPESVAANFYKSLADGKWSSWGEEIIFLREIDSHRATKYFLLPDIKKTINHLFEGGPVFDDNALFRYLQGVCVARNTTSREGKEEIAYYVKRIRVVDTQHYRQLDSVAYDALFSAGKYLQAKSWMHGFIINPSSITRSYLDIANDRGEEVLAELRSRLTNTVSQLIRDHSQWAGTVSHAEVPRAFTDIS